MKAVGNCRPMWRPRDKLPWLTSQEAQSVFPSYTYYPCTVQQDGPWVRVPPWEACVAVRAPVQADLGIPHMKTNRPRTKGLQQVAQDTTSSLVLRPARGPQEAPQHRQHGRLISPEGAGPVVK